MQSLKGQRIIPSSHDDSRVSSLMKSTDFERFLASPVCEVAEKANKARLCALELLRSTDSGLGILDADINIKLATQIRSESCGKEDDKDCTQIDTKPVDDIFFHFLVAAMSQ